MCLSRYSRFNCGRWFARSEDDSSVERLLIAERVPQTIAKSGAMSALSKLLCITCLWGLFQVLTHNMLVVTCTFWGDGVQKLSAPVWWFKWGWFPLPSQFMKYEPCVSLYDTREQSDHFLRVHSKQMWTTSFRHLPVDEGLAGERVKEVSQLLSY